MDPVKLMGDHVILLEETEEKIQAILEACKRWVKENALEYTPATCTIIVPKMTAVNETFILTKQSIPIKKILYLVLKISSSVFRKDTNEDTKMKFGLYHYWSVII